MKRSFSVSASLICLVSCFSMSSSNAATCSDVGQLLAGKWEADGQEKWKFENTTIVINERTFTSIAHCDISGGTVYFDYGNAQVQCDKNGIQEGNATCTKKEAKTSGDAYAGRFETREIKISRVAGPANATPSTQPSSSAQQDCSVLNGTWRTTFSSSRGDNTMDWKWQASGNQASIGMYETDGKLLSSAPLSSCAVSGNTVTYQTGSGPQVRLELAGDKQSFTGTSYANGMQIRYTGQRVGGTPAAVANSSIDSVPSSGSAASSSTADIKDLKRQADSLYAQKGDREAQKQAYGLYGQIAEQSTDKKLLADVRAKMKKLEKAGVNKGDADGGMPSADSVMLADTKNCPQVTIDFGNQWDRFAQQPTQKMVQLPGGHCGTYVHKNVLQGSMTLKQVYEKPSTHLGFLVGGIGCWREHDVWLAGSISDKQIHQYTYFWSKRVCEMARGLPDTSGECVMSPIEVSPYSMVHVKRQKYADDYQEHLRRKPSCSEMRDESNRSRCERDLAVAKELWEAAGCIEQNYHDYEVAAEEALNYYKTGGKTVKWYGKTIDPNKK